LIEEVLVHTNNQGLHDMTKPITDLVASSGISEGLCTLFVQHTSASLLVQENYEVSAKRDLEVWLNRLVPENPEQYSHSSEGPDDMPAHIKSALTATSVNIPILDGKLGLGTWQGIFLWEHRRSVHTRKVLVHLA
tara:strand:+ start:591 stop:995 length:405 start_codon:yes stop_codon:yes gene_type:complete